MMNNNWNGESKVIVGQMVLIKRFSTEDPVELVALDSHQFCSKTDKGFLRLHNIKDMMPIPDPKEIAKQKAIDEMFKLTKDCAFASDARLILYNAGYTKSKVKPLPRDWYNTYHNSLDDPQLSVYKYLIENGYCIGGAE
jgi:hypothetical protein